MLDNADEGVGMREKKEKLVKFLTACAELWEKEVSDGMISLYWAVLKDYGDDELSKAFVEVLRTSKIFPKPADVVSCIERGRKENAYLAYERVLQTIKEEGAYSSVCFWDRKINGAVKVLGGWVDVCNADTRFLMKSFIDAYSESGIEEDYLPGIIEMSGGEKVPVVFVGQRKSKRLKVDSEKIPQLIARFRLRLKGGDRHARRIGDGRSKGTEKVSQGNERACEK